MFQSPRRRTAPSTAQDPGDRRWAQDPSWRATGISAAEAFHEAASSISDSVMVMVIAQDLRPGTGLAACARDRNCMCPAVLNNAAMRDAGCSREVAVSPTRRDQSDDG